jgi:signal transduction histidine kinase
MNISRQLKSVSRRFIFIIVTLSVLSVGLLSFTLYETNSIRFRDGISPNELQEVIKDDEAVVEYLESEKDFEAHFVTIASLVKQDQQKLLGKALLLTTVPVIFIVTVLSYFVARYLLKPVRQSYESQERFLQDAAHELRNPLAAMSLAIENADKTGTDQNLVKTMRRQRNREAREAIDRRERVVRECPDIIENLLGTPKKFVAEALKSEGLVSITMRPRGHR